MFMLFNSTFFLSICPKKRTSKFKSFCDYPLCRTAFLLFKTKILCFQGKQSAGKNRNIACSHAEGDILIAQDADDIPHPQRIEIIKYVFENYATEHLLHSYFVGEKPFSPYDVSDIKIYQYPTYNAIDFSNEFHDRIH